MSSGHFIREARGTSKTKGKIMLDNEYQNSVRDDDPNDDDPNDGHWNDENELPAETGWYLCDAVDQRWGKGVFKYRAWGRGHWWIPLADGWMSSPVGTYRWVGPAHDINGPSPHGDNPQLVKRGK